MSYKPIDLQTSLPRTVELSPLQQQQQMRTALEQEALAQQAVKQAEQRARSNAKLEEAGGRTISDREPRERRQEPKPFKGRREREADGEAGEKPAHPYKGKHLDITL